MESCLSYIIYTHMHKLKPIELDSLVPPWSSAGIAALKIGPIIQRQTITSCLCLPRPLLLSFVGPLAAWFVSCQLFVAGTAAFELLLPLC